MLKFHCLLICEKYLQDVTILVLIVKILDIGVTQEKAESIKTLPLFELYPFVHSNDYLRCVRRKEGSSTY